MGCSNSKADLDQEERSLAPPPPAEVDSTDAGISDEEHSPVRLPLGMQPLTEEDVDRLVRERVPAVCGAASPEGALGAAGATLMWSIPSDGKDMDTDGAALFPYLSMLREMVAEERGSASLARLLREGLASEDMAVRMSSVVALCEAVQCEKQWRAVDTMYTALYREDMGKAMDAAVDAETRRRCQSLMAEKQLPFDFAHGLAFKLFSHEANAQHKYAGRYACDLLCSIDTIAQWEAVQAEYERLSGTPLPDVLSAHMPAENYARVRAALQENGIPFTPAEAVVHYIAKALAPSAPARKTLPEAEDVEAHSLGLDQAEAGDDDAVNAQEPAVEAPTAPEGPARDALVLVQLARVSSFPMWEEVLRLWSTVYGSSLHDELEARLSPAAYADCHAAFKARGIAFTLAEVVAARLATALAGEEVAAESILPALLLLRTHNDWVDAQESYAAGSPDGPALVEALAAGLSLAALAEGREALGRKGISFSIAHAVALELQDALAAGGCDEGRLLHALGLVGTMAEWDEVQTAFEAVAGADLLESLQSHLPVDVYSACHKAMKAKLLPFTHDEAVAYKLLAAVTREAPDAVDEVDEIASLPQTPVQEVMALLDAVPSGAAWERVQTAFAEQSFAPLVEVLEEFLTAGDFAECAAALAAKGIPFTPAQAAAAQLFAALNGTGAQEDIVAEVLQHLRTIDTAAQWRDVQAAFEAAYSRDLLRMCEDVLSQSELAEAVSIFTEKGLSLYPPCRAIAAQLHQALDAERRHWRRNSSAPPVDVPVVYEQLGAVGSLAEWVEVQEQYAALYLRDLLPTLDEELSAEQFEECHAIFAANGVPFTVVEGIAAGIRLALAAEDPASVYREVLKIHSPRVWEEVQNAYQAAYDSPLAATLLADLPEDTLEKCLDLMRARDIPFAPAEARAKALHAALTKIGTDVDAVLATLGKVATAEEWLQLQAEYVERFGVDLLAEIEAEVPPQGLQQCRVLFNAKKIAFSAAEDIAAALHDALLASPVDVDLLLPHFDRIESAQQWAAVQGEYAAAYGEDLVGVLKAVVDRDDIAACVSVLDAKDIAFTPAYNVAKALHRAVNQLEDEDEDGADAAAQEELIAAALMQVGSFGMWEDVQEEYEALAGEPLLDDLRATLSSTGLLRCDSIFKDSGVPFTAAQAAAVRLHDALSDADLPAVVQALARLASQEEWDAVQAAYSDYYASPLRDAFEAALSEAGLAECRAVLKEKRLPYTDAEIAARDLLRALDGECEASVLEMLGALGSQEEWDAVQAAFADAPGDLLECLHARLSKESWGLLRELFTSKGLYLTEVHAIAGRIAAALARAAAGVQGVTVLGEVDNVVSEEQWGDVQGWYKADHGAVLVDVLRARLSAKDYLDCGDALALKGVPMTPAHAVARTLAKRVQEAAYGAADATRIHDALRQVTGPEEWSVVADVFSHSLRREVAPALASALGRIPLTVAQFMMGEKDIVLVSNAHRVANAVFLALERDVERRAAPGEVAPVKEATATPDSATLMVAPESAAVAELTLIDDAALWEEVRGVYPDMYNRQLLFHIEATMPPADYAKCAAAFAENGLPFTPIDFRALRCHVALTSSPTDTAVVTAELTSVRDESEWTAVVETYSRAYGSDLVWLVKSECSTEQLSGIEAVFQSRSVVFEQRTVSAKETQGEGEDEEDTESESSDWEVEDPFKNVCSPVAKPGSPNAKGFNYDRVRNRVHVEDP
eukprot:TRINITY_DN2508_c0_g1_i1.p1 TRINITY_DN2508_c0_g1~~TRINITY_DN2508_c0_g1_i1.p1  ORF type:complete len:1719 (+),score=631.27 TRINITY_DN2508_c0_g1_i1:42-5198(+)